jgi:hypothetical protein
VAGVAGLDQLKETEVLASVVEVKTLLYNSFMAQEMLAPIVVPNSLTGRAIRGGIHQTQAKF